MTVFERFDTSELVDLGLNPEEAEAIQSGLRRAESISDPAARWTFVSREVLAPKHPAVLHRGVFESNHRDTPASDGPAPAWTPGPDARSRTNLGRLIESLGFADQSSFRDWSLRDRAGFWGLMVDRLPVLFDRRGERILDSSNQPESTNWFPGSLLNLSKSCFQADPSAIAIREHAENRAPRDLTYQELDRLSNRVANGLTALGFRGGDAVGMFLPMSIEAVAALLGIHKAGCVAVGVPESFVPQELEARLSIAGARLVVTQDVTIRRGHSHKIHEKLTASTGFRAIVVSRSAAPARIRPGDLTWDDFLSDSDGFEPVSQNPDDHATILFSSGTTAEPKAIPWTQTTAIKAAADGYLYHDIQPGDVACWPTSPGWMMGPWLVYATLMNRGTIALYDGHPGTSEFCQFVDQAAVTILGLVPSLVSAWKAERWPTQFDWSRIKLFSSTGECSNPADMLELMSWAGYRPVIEYCGGTEVGGGYLTSTLLRPNAPSCFNTVAFGIGLEIRDESGVPSDRGEGYLVGPSVGLSRELLHRDHHAVYFEGTPIGTDGSPLRRHGDQVERLPGGYFRVLGRMDDTMNLGGIKVSSVEIERVLALHPAVRECAAVASQDGSGGPERLVVHVVPEPGFTDPIILGRALQGILGDCLNPLFRISEVVLVDSLPRTASNKIMRRRLRSDGSTTREA